MKYKNFKNNNNRVSINEFRHSSWDWEIKYEYLNGQYALQLSSMKWNLVNWKNEAAETDKMKNEYIKIRNCRDSAVESDKMKLEYLKDHSSQVW